MGAMTELVEYALVVMASTLFVAGSVLVYGNFSSFESGLSLRATFEEVSALASRAVENGSAQATLSMPGSVISCEGGVLSVEVGASSENETLPVGCGFVRAVPVGVHTLLFTSGSSWLGLSVE